MSNVLFSLVNSSIKFIQTHGFPEAKTNFEALLNSATENTSIVLANTGLKKRANIDLIEGASLLNKNNRTGSSFRLSDGTYVPPISKKAYYRIVDQLPKEHQAAFDHQFFYVLLHSPFLVALASDLEQGILKTEDYVANNVFNTAAYVEKELIPAIIKQANIHQLSVKEYLPYIQHSLSAIRSPIVNVNKEIKPGIVDSFSENEGQSFTEKQMTARWVMKDVPLTSANKKLLDKLEQERSVRNLERLSSIAALARAPQVTYGSGDEVSRVYVNNILLNPEGYSTELVNAARDIKMAETKAVNKKDELDTMLKQFAQSHTDIILSTLSEISFLPENYGNKAANFLNATTMLGAYAHRYQTELSYDLPTSYKKARNEVIRYFQKNPARLSQSDLAEQLIRDQIDNSVFWQQLSDNDPSLKSEIKQIKKVFSQLTDLTITTNEKDNKLFNIKINSKDDITTEGVARDGAAMYKKIANDIDAIFKHHNDGSEAYRNFRAVIAINLREVPDVNSTASPDAMIHIHGFENLATTDLTSSSPQHSLRLQAMYKLYNLMLSNNDIQTLDGNKLQSLFSFASRLVNGHEPENIELIKKYPDLVKLAEKYNSLLLQIIGLDGERLSSNLFAEGMLAHKIEGFPVIINQEEGQKNNNVSAIANQIPEFSLKQITSYFFGNANQISLTKQALLDLNLKFGTKINGDLMLSGSHPTSGDNFFLNLTEAKVTKIFDPLEMKYHSVNADNKLAARQLNSAVGKNLAKLGGVIR